ncbi:type IV conjugative transfer system protein TraL [Rhodobacterales bacterium 52_120_T64]|nr:type IV conjugative transfer system protein TraL [Rhodobacterales bacterium 52_120_T64]
MHEHYVKIEQRLQEQPRILFFSLDEAVVLFAPLVFGLVSRHAITGVVVGFVLWQIWKRIKGDGGTEWIVASAYWYLPKEISIYRKLADASVTVWRG